MDTQAQLSSQEQFLNSLLADPTSAPVGQELLEEMKADVVKRNADLAKDRLRQIANNNAEVLASLRKLDKRREQAKAALDRLRRLAQDALEGKIDETELSFSSQLYDAATIKGPRVNI